MPKRKATGTNRPEETIKSRTLRRSSRHASSDGAMKNGKPENKTSRMDQPEAKVSKVTKSTKVKKPMKPKAGKKEEIDEDGDGLKADGTADTTNGKSSTSATTKATKGAASKTTSLSTFTTTTSSPSKRYWLMKAEPESRLVRGHDVKFSIDDLAAKKEPEPWDARNNLRAMKKGDLAFFYQSSCKVPAIVGIMEIVGEAEPDLSALDPSAPYFDPHDSAASPRWSIVRCAFRRKLRAPLTLAELRRMGDVGGPLEDMRLLRQSRLSVSPVGPGEWQHLVRLIEEREEEVEDGEEEEEE